VGGAAYVLATSASSSLGVSASLLADPESWLRAHLLARKVSQIHLSVDRLLENVIETMLSA
jgi:hypothetical protein